MIKIGEWNHLEVVKEKDFGIYLAEKKIRRRGSPASEETGTCGNKNGRSIRCIYLS